MDRNRYSVWAGMIGPVLFVTTFTVEGWLRPGYEPLRMFVSELSLGSRGWIQIVNFVALGILLLVFSRAVAREFRTGRASKAGPIIIAIIGVSFIASGIFVMDPVMGTLRFAPPADQVSWHARLHGMFGNLVFTLAPISCFVFFTRFAHDSEWRSFGWCTLVGGMLILVAVILMALGPARPPAASNRFNELVGAIQRIAIIIYLGWLFTFAFAFRRRSLEGDRRLAISPERAAGT